MSNTQSNHRNKRTVPRQHDSGRNRIFVICKPLLMVVHTKGSSLTANGRKVQTKQGCTSKVSKVVALETAKSWFTSLGRSFPVGLVRLPVVGGLPFNRSADRSEAK